MLLHLSALIALLRGLSLSPPRCPCPVFCLYLSVEACLSPSLPFAVFALRLVGCDNVCCSSLVLSITASSRRFPAVNSQSIYVPFGLVNSKKKIKNKKNGQVPGDHAAAAVELRPPQEPLVGKRSWVFPTYLLGVQEFLEHMTTHIQDYLAQPLNGLGAMDLWSDLKVSIKLCTLAYCYSPHGFGVGIPPCLCNGSNHGGARKMCLPPLSLLWAANLGWS